MIPILIPIVSALMGKGMTVLADAVVAKGRDWVEDKIGMKLPASAADLSPEFTVQLQQAEMAHEAVLIQAALEEKRIDVDNTKSARDMNARIQESEKAAHLAKVAAYYLDFLIVGSTLAMAALIIFKRLPEGNNELAYMIFGSLMALCGTVLNFHRGTSASSKANGDAMRSLVK